MVIKTEQLLCLENSLSTAFKTTLFTKPKGPWVLILITHWNNSVSALSFLCVNPDGNHSILSADEVKLNHVKLKALVFAKGKFCWVGMHGAWIHREGRALTSDWFVNSFVTVVCENKNCRAFGQKNLAK